MTGLSKGLLRALRGPQRSMLQKKNDMFQGPETTQSNGFNMKGGQRSHRMEYERQHLPGQAGVVGEAEDEGSWGRQAMLAVLGSLLTVRRHWQLGRG